MLKQHLIVDFMEVLKIECDCILLILDDFFNVLLLYRYINKNGSYTRYYS